jgi:hypothetical protein
LPPTPEDVEAFEKTDDPLAYEKLIDRLLASPHYGEQWGRHWLDIARYADTKGYVYAREQRFWVHAWPYRDWVVKSLNDDLPYDRFVLLQIAADQAPGAARADLAAMGFLTLGRRFIGVTHDIIDDRIDVVTRGTMGLTVACARCHDHKYDPIPTADYYSLYGVFQNCTDSLTPIADPPAGDAQVAAFENELHKRQSRLNAMLAKRRAEAGARLRSRIADYLVAQTELQKYPDEGFDQALETTDVIPASVRRWQAYLALARKRRDPIFSAWQAFAQLKPAEFARQAPQVAADLLRKPAAEVHPLVAASVVTPPPQSIAEVAQRYAAMFAKVDAQWQAALAAAKHQKQQPPTSLADADAESLRAVLYGPHAPCEIPREPIVHTETYFDLHACEELWKLQAAVDTWIIESPVAPPYAGILTDRDEPLPAYVFKRGRPANKGDEAARQFLSLLAGANRQPFRKGSGRLELAQAIVDPHNPLTARVIVNRVWQHHFGAGLNRTPSDFGTRAPRPIHAALLDYLATRFIAEGWSLKKLHRRIMLSDAYCQSSAGPGDAAARAKAIEADPDNRLLWRMNEHRATFEELRDALLAATGELDLRVGGRPAELFAPDFNRRTLYGLVDRQFLPSTLRMFDFANPDLHIPQRSDTTVPQQALFFLNSDLLLARAKKLAERTEHTAAPAERVQAMFRLAYQRAPTPHQVAAALALVDSAAQMQTAEVSPGARDWQYGFAALDEKTLGLSNFQPLPHFTGSAWQGGAAWPDAKLGWVQLSAAGGHPGNDLTHVAVRRWTAPRDLHIRIDSTLVHEPVEGDGVRGAIVASRAGQLATASVHHGQAPLNVAALAVKAGDTIDFAVDILHELNSDQFTWQIAITPLSAAPIAPGPDTAPPIAWNSVSDFRGASPAQLTPWQQLAQVLFAANEFTFVD